MTERYRSSPTDIIAQLQRRLNALERRQTTERHHGTGVKWIAPTLLNSWVNYGAPYNTAAYMRTDDGLVLLRGAIKSGTTTAGTVLFTLPVGFRPAGGTAEFVSVSNGAIAQIDVETDGDVVIRVGGNTRLSLDGIVFAAEG